MARPAGAAVTAVPVTPASVRALRTRARLRAARRFVSVFVRARLPAAAAVLLSVVAVCGALAGALEEVLPTGQSIAERLLPPLSSSASGFHLLGTDALGRDELALLVQGAQVSLLIGVVAVVVAGTVGVALGMIAGYVGGWLETVIMRWTDIQLAVPFLVLAIAVAAVLGPGLDKVILVLATTGWVQYTRLVRGEVLRIRELEFVTASRVCGARTPAVLLRHVLPNLRASVIVLASLQVARFLLLEASLSFLGVGVPVSTITWGRMVAEGRDYVGIAWWVCAVPGMATFLTVVAINLCGDRLRDLLDPKYRDG